jgi:hypothetical protein
MEEEIIEVDPQNESGDGLLFDSSVLDSLNKLTDEIQEDLLTDGDSDEGSDSYDSDDYTDEDDDPDSGENKLFNMMDDLVMELQMELQDDDAMPVMEAVDDNNAPNDTPTASVEDDSNDKKQSESTTPQPSPQKENAVNVAAAQDESKPPSSPSPPPATYIPPTDRTNVPLSEYERAEKQRRMHAQVKLLLHRVSIMAEQAEAQERSQGAADPNHPAVGGRPRGDSSADKLERLLGALSSYSPPPTATPAFATLPEGQAKTARAMSSYTQRKRREYLLRKQAAAGNEQAGGGKGAPATVTPPSNKDDTTAASTNPKNKKRRPRTNKHKKGKQKQSSPTMANLQYHQQMRQMRQQQYLQQQQQQEAHHAQAYSPTEPIPPQSLRTLLSQLLALDERLSQGQVMI